MSRHAMNVLSAVAAAALLLAGSAASAQAPQEPTPAPTPAPGAQPAPAAPSGPAAPTAAPHPAPADVATAADAGRPTYDLSLGAGIRYADVSGTREKLEEYGRVGEGLVVDGLVLRAQRPATGYAFELYVANATRDDERYRLSVGRQGRYRLTAEYQAVPHRFAPGTFLFGGIGTERLLLGDVVQEQLQANEVSAVARGGPPPAGDPTASPPPAGDVETQRIVNGLYQSTDPTALGLVRKQLRTQLDVELPAGANAWVRIGNENRVGTRIRGTGAYERWQDGAGTAHTIDRFIVYGAELAEPIDSRTLSLAGGLGIRGHAWLAEVEYSRTSFRNFDDVLLWDNPFRIADAAQVGSVDRSRFAVGQLVLAPNSVSNDVTASMALDLPMNGRLGASLSWGMVTQDDAFFPYTRNSAITATDFDGNPAGPASSAALPARDLSGDIRTLAANLSAAFRPVTPVGVTARYRAYRFDNRSAAITFPGYAAFGESGWRRERNDVTSGLDAPVANEVFDYWRHEADLGIDYRVTRMLSASLEGGWEAWRFDHLRIDALDEFSVGAGVTVRPARNASLRARYRYADRNADGYVRGATAENPEPRGMLNYNWSDRRRHLADVRAQYSPGRMISLGVSGRLVDDDYGGKTEGDAPIDAFRFGRSALRTWLASADVTVTPAERLSLEVTYAHERRREELRTAAKDDGAKATDDFGFADSYAPENYWNSRIDETVHTLGLAARVQLVRELLSLDLGYDLSLSDVDVGTTNPNPIVATTLANARAVDWPTIRSRLHETSADLGWQVSPRVRAGARYLFAWYDLEDWAWDIMLPYMAGVSAENSTRMVFADATYGGYRAHVGTLYVAGSF